MMDETSARPLPVSDDIAEAPTSSAWLLAGLAFL